ncbi:hypothetical protein MVEG_11824 [Podila verticillata NRRL 6337]|uniref:TIGR02453 family protein n=1 Tax=Podila verticillata NRRL 6337 TaxID=1069443 RepID=A0A086TJQ9_9FUNG|nr:MAG: hypothetical protein BYD32DRAFT_423919 [Podila humilis]KFH62186.1 hypothetical protein MVEG_11824 [Podila verticillata NRRL 6337]
MSPATTSRPKRAAAAAKVTTKQSEPAKKTTNKRSHKAVTGARKRAKDESDQEDEPEDEEESDQDDEDNYGEEEEQSNDSDDDDAFEDDSTVRRAISRNKKTAAIKSKPAPLPKSSKSSKSSTKTSQSSPKKTKSNETVVPTQEWVVSKLKIPRPKGGPAADAVQPETLEFIRDLKENNDREYMFLNQERFLAAKTDFMDFIRMVKEGLLEADPDVMDQEPKDSMMRIYRDIRFSNDKTPYKRQLSCHWSKGGKKSIAAGYYFSVSSGDQSFIGCGVWDPNGPALNRIRQGIVNHADRFNAILETDAIKEIKGGLSGIDALQPGSSQLKTGPVGFDKNHPMIEFLKRKSFAIGRTFTDKEVVNPGFLEEVLKTYDACVDFVHILNDWIG